MKDNNKLVPVEHNNQRILTTEQVAEAYGTEAKILLRNFNRNKNRYLEGKHYYRLEGEILRQFLALHTSNCRLQNPEKIRVLYLWTEKGAWLLAKSLNTDQAWQACEMLVDEYYRQNDEITMLREQLAGLHQSAPLQLPAPIFKTGHDAYFAEPHCPCPTPDRVEAAIIKTVQWLQPYCKLGVAGRDLMMHNEEIQSYVRTYGVGALLASAESLVTHTILNRIEEKDGGYLYTIAPITAYLPAPQQGEEA